VPKADGYADYAEDNRDSDPYGHAPGQPQDAEAGPQPLQAEREPEVSARPRRRHRTSGGGSRSARRQRSIRSTITWLLVLPILTLIGLETYSFFNTLPGSIANHNNSTVNNDVGGALSGLLTQLSTESAQTYALGTLQASLKAATSLSPAQKEQKAASMTPAELQKEAAQLKQGQQEATALAAQLKAQQPKTDAAVTAFEAGQAKVNSTKIETAKDTGLASEVIDQLKNVTTLRAEAQAGATAPLTVLQGYIAIVNTLFPYVGAMANANSTIPMFSQSTATIFGGEALLDVTTEAALGSGALVDNGQLTKPVYQLFAQTVEQQRQLQQSIGTLTNFETANSTDPFVAAFASAQFKSFAALEDKVIAAGPDSTFPVTPQAWQQQTQTTLGVLESASTQERTTVTKNAQHSSDVTNYELFGISGGGLILVILSSVLLLRFGNRVSRELRSLRGAAQELAFRRLPKVVGRLRSGDSVDVEAEAPPLRLGTRTREVTETADAFSEVQRTAVYAAVEQAMLRQAVSNVFRRLARRNQGLLQRQLKMLDEMERGTHDPDALGQLFRLDHLTTRMRRQAEGLIILSGATPGRSWRKPVPVVEVLRGAISEIEDYVRVDLLTDSPDYLQGTGVADVTHLLAELIENAVTYSPPATRVQVRGGRVANGYVVEVEDRGLGVPPEIREQLNQRLEQTPEFDLADSDQLGMFVVSRLANRHGIKVQLRDSNYGGTLAIVLLPASLVVSEDEAAFITEQESGSRPGVGGRTRVAAAAAVGGRRRSRDTGANPVNRNSGPLPPAGSGPLPAAGTGPFSPASIPGGGGTASPGGTGGLPIRSPGGGPRPAGYGMSGGQPALGGGSGSFPAADSGGFSNGGGFSNDPGPASGPAGLPRRERSAHMAAELRDRTDPPAGPELPGKSPEQARALMSSIQRGLRTGRNSSDGDGDVNENDGRRMR
jgi:signal transduction histidine kinase